MNYFEERDQHWDEVQSKAGSHGLRGNANSKTEDQFSKDVHQFTAAEAQRQAVVYNLTQTNTM